MKPLPRLRVFLLMVAVILTVAIPVARAQGLPAIVIDEVLVGNASTNLDLLYTNYSAWIELRNTTGAIANLDGYKVRSLPDGATTPDVYALPAGIRIPAGGRLLLWADEENNGVHMSIELDMDGGEIALLGPGGAVIDSVTLGAQQPDVSYGRLPGGNWAYFDQPTPGAANNTPGYPDYDFAAAPTFSVPGGRHAGSLAVSLATTQPGATIRYTRDGSIPTAASPVYSAPLAVNTTTVIRARTFAPGKMTSPTRSQTYLVNVPDNLPAVSIATDPAHMFDNRIGIFVVGTNGLLNCARRANWNQPWERPASVEFYDSSGALMVAQDIGFEIHGNCSRNLNMKSFELKARKVYGDNDFDYPFFSDKPLTSYRRLILRTGGQDAAFSMLRDALASRLVAGRMDLDRGSYRPVAVYINGAFWGIYGLREKMDEDFVENTYGLDEETDFDALEETAEVLAGNAVRWNAFHSYVSANDLANPAVYAYVKTQMDVDEFINYQIAEIYSANRDWPHQNVRMWRGYSPDSRWRWMFHDVDYGFGLRIKNGFRQNTLQQAMKADKRNAYGSLFMRKLSTNPEFRAEFAQRFAVHLNTTYEPARVLGIVNDMAAAVAPDMPAQIARWRLPRSLTVWQNEINALRAFANQRPQFMRTYLNTYLRSPGMDNLTVQIVGTGAVTVAGVEVADGYSGPHFRNTPVTLRAIVPPGRVFVRWQETGQTTPQITLVMTGATTRTAVFDDEPPPPAPPDLVINELHYHPPNAVESVQEFVEIYSRAAAPVDLSGYTIPAISYTFPPGASIDPGEYVVVAADATNALFAGVPAGALFDFAFGSPDSQKLSNSSERVALLDTYSQVVDQVTYDDGLDDANAPTGWPITPDGDGPTLALLDPATNNALPASWAASRENGGTPGAENFPPLPPAPPLVINEIHYNPAGGSAYEFIEIVNVDAAAVDLSGVTLAGVDFTFPAGASIDPGELIVLAADSANYGGAYDVYQWTSGDLDDAGERVALLDALGQVADEVTYDDEAPWPASPDGGGPSLSLGGTGLDNSVAANWGASAYDGGTPGAANWPALPLVITELHYNVNSTLQPGGDDTWEFMEIVNTGSQAFDLSGYDLFGVTYTFPAGSSIAAGETIVVANLGATYSGAGCTVHDWTSGGLSSNGEEIKLMRFGVTVMSLTYDDLAPWPTAPDGLGPSLSLLDTSLDPAAGANWAASPFVGGTPCAANFPLPPLVINEVHYNPAAPQDATYEFIELINTGTAAVYLGDFTLAGVDFTFPAGTTLAGGAYLVVAAEDANYAGSLQWAAGDLDDAGERVAVLDGRGRVVDEVTYGVAAPWPDAPNGAGPALALRDPASDNELAGSWAPSNEAGGTPGTANNIAP